MRFVTITFSALLAISSTLCAAPAPLEKGLLLDNEKNNIQIFKQISPLVVNVYRVERFPTLVEGNYIRAGAGSGFFWDMDGHIVTNYHVVQNAQTIAISVGGGKVLTAKIVGVEPRKDIAVLQLQVPDEHKLLAGMPKLTLANSDALQVGQKAIAIGNPYGLDRTLTTGVVSAVGRRLTGIGDLSIYDMIQTDASINPGNSGGPLLDSSGHLIGMNTLIFSRSGSSSGIGFAVPSNTIKRVVAQLIQYGEVRHRGLGIQVLDVRLASQLATAGLVIGRVVPGSPADKMGLKGTIRTESGAIIFGDVITSINNQRVNNFDDYYNILERIAPDEQVDVQYKRDDKILNIKMSTIDVSSLK